MYKKQGKVAFSMSCTTVRTHQHFRKDAFGDGTTSDVTIGMWRHTQPVTNQVMPWYWKKLPIYKSKDPENFAAMHFLLVMWSRQLPDEWPEACISLIVVGAGIMHDFGDDPIKNQAIWLVKSQNQGNNLHIMIESDIYHKPSECVNPALRGTARNVGCALSKNVWGTKMLHREKNDVSQLNKFCRSPKFKNIRRS